MRLGLKPKKQQNRKKNVARNGGPASKLQREQAKVFKDKKQGKEDAKTRYKPEKVPLKESAKSVASTKSTRKKALVGALSAISCIIMHEFA